MRSPDTTTTGFGTIRPATGSSIRAARTTTVRGACATAVVSDRSTAPSKRRFLIIFVPLAPGPHPRRDLSLMPRGRPLRMAAGERDRHAELSGERGVVDPLRHFHPVQLHAEQPRARNRVTAHRAGGPLAAVIADEHGRGERVVNPLHHFQRTRKSADEPHIVRQLLDEHALSVAVRVADDDVGGPALTGLFCSPLCLACLPP